MNPAQLTDDELRAGMKPSALATQIESRGFLLVFLLGVLVVGNILLLGLQRVGLELLYLFSPTLYDWMPPLEFLTNALGWLGVAFALVLSAWCTTMWSFGKRQRACRSEWDKRYPLGIEVTNAEVALEKGEADWILILSARFLPHGGMMWIRTDLRNGDAPFGPVHCRQFEDGESILA